MLKLFRIDIQKLLNFQLDAVPNLDLSKYDAHITLIHNLVFRYKRSRSRERRKIVWRSSSSISSRSSKSRSRSKIKSLSRSCSRSTSKTKSRSRSSSSTSSTSISSNRSRSQSVSKKIELPPKAPLPRYYGRKKSDQSSSDLADSSEDEKVSNKPVSIP